MIKTTPGFKKYVFVCENLRETGKDCCGAQGAKIRETLKQEIRHLKLNKIIRVSRTGCQAACAQGPNVLVMPDHIWYHHVTLDDIPQILKEMSQNLGEK